MQEEDSPVEEERPLIPRRRKSTPKKIKKRMNLKQKIKLNRELQKQPDTLFDKMKADYLKKINKLYESPLSKKFKKIRPQMSQEEIEEEYSRRFQTMIEENFEPGSIGELKDMLGFTQSRPSKSKKVNSLQFFNPSDSDEENSGPVRPKSRSSKLRGIVSTPRLAVKKKSAIKKYVPRFKDGILKMDRKKHKK